MIRIDFDVAVIRASLEKAQGKLADLTPIHQSIAQYVVKATKDRFATSTAPDGTGWAAKKPATIARYKARGDGNLTKPLIGPSLSLSRNILSHADATSAEIGSNMVYSAVMQDGALKGAFGTSPSGRPLPWGNIPARVWLGLSNADEGAILGIVDDEIADALGT